MAPEPADPQVHSPAAARYEMRWREFYDRLRARIPELGFCFGIPRGGSVVAAATGRAVDCWQAANFLVDDIRDSGETAAKWNETTKLPVFVLVDKQACPQDRLLPWVVFPWERTDAEIGPEANVRRLLQWMGEDVDRPGLLATPRRVCVAYKELTAGYSVDLAKLLTPTFPEPTDEMIVLRGIRFASLCEHHLLPFSGTATVGYVPGPSGVVVGLSKLARLVKALSSRLQIQERLTREIAEALQAHLTPQGTGVILCATHQCMACRGILQPDAEAVTSCLLGGMRESAAARAELLSLATHR